MLEAHEERIIPAGAGKRQEPPPTALRGENHPRGCGEKLVFTGDPLTLPESSPRVRGKGAVKAGLKEAVGIIPAGAGKSLHLPLRARQHWGSSPRVRGKDANALGEVLGAGIIPAGAGKRGGPCLRG